MICTTLMLLIVPGTVERSVNQSRSVPQDKQEQEGIEQKEEQTGAVMSEQTDDNQPRATVSASELLIQEAILSIPKLPDAPTLVTLDTTGSSTNTGNAIARILSDEVYSSMTPVVAYDIDTKLGLYTSCLPHVSKQSDHC